MKFAIDLWEPVLSRPKRGSWRALRYVFSSVGQARRYAKHRAIGVGQKARIRNIASQETWPL